MSPAVLFDMTQPQMLNVEVEELLARAAELEAPIPGLPTENPQAPCALDLAATAAQQLGFSADNMRTYLATGERERLRLAESLRNAAKAYEEVDEDAAAAINAAGSVSAVTPGLADRDAVTLGDTPIAAAGGLEYADVIQTAWAIETGDQGAALKRFAEEWSAYQRPLREAAYRFRPFVHWEGDAAYAMEANFDQHRSWLFQMADMCGNLATQARGVASAHRTAFDDHVSLPKGFLSSNSGTPGFGADMLRYDHKRLVEMQTYYVQNPDNHTMRQQWGAAFTRFQQKSEEVVAEYGRAADLQRLNPPKPPVPYRIEPPSADKPGRDDPGLDLPDGDWPSPGDELPSGDELPDPTGMPSAPSAGLPTMPTPDDTALPEVPSYPIAGSTGSGLKPASFGGGGLGRGVPSMPLQPPVDLESAARAGAARDLAGLGRAAPGAAMGAGGMGMPPMGGRGAGQGENKGKRAQGDDESLYTEDRSWTEGILGHHRPARKPGSMK